MTTKILSSVIEGAYVLSSPVTTLSVTASGYVALGITTASNGAYTVVNHGDIVNANTSSGSYTALAITGSGVVVNSGTIKSYDSLTGAGLVLGGGGKVTNQAGGVIIGYGGVEVIGAAGTVANDGTIAGVGKYGVALVDGGVVTNGDASHTGAIIEGNEAVISGLAATLHNYGTVIGTGTAGAAGYLKAGGVITNGSATDKTALMTATVEAVGITGAGGTLINFGTVRGTGTVSAGAILEDGGQVTNGSASDTSATISGNTFGVAAVNQAATVTNFGAIIGGYDLGGGSASGVYLKMGGVVTNGSSTDKTASITGLLGVGIEGATGTIRNFATIGGVATEIGAVLTGGGVVTNGSSTDTTALIQGYIGVAVQTLAGTVMNFGTIKSGVAPASLGSIVPGVFFSNGGKLVNGSAADTTASITGALVGVYAAMGAAATVTNFGLISGTEVGEVLAGGGSVVNGSASDTGAQITGGLGGMAIENTVGALANFGTIRGGHIVNSSFGAAVTGGGQLTNGSATDHVALITGSIGAYGAGATKITNYGTIIGDAVAGGVGVKVGAGASFTNEATGVAQGDIGVDVAASATATNFGVFGGSGGYAVVLADGTSRLNAEAGSKFIGTIEAGAGLVDAVSGVSTCTALVTGGKVKGAGTIHIVGGASYLDPGASLLVSEIELTGASTSVYVDTKLTDSRKWVQNAGTMTVTFGERMTFTGVGDHFSGSIIGPGTVDLGGGTDDLTNVTLAAGKVIISKATVTLAGTIDDVGPVAVTTPNLIVAAGGATLTGGGVITLSNLVTNSIHGATASATLHNGDVIKGAGQIGGGTMSLVNTGTIESTGSVILTIDTGANTVINSGLIEAVGAGHKLFISGSSAVDNTGTLATVGGFLVVDSQVTGAGVVRVNGGQATFARALAENVSFGTTGGLRLGDSQAFTGQVTGFSKTGATSLDLLDINFTSATASYSGTSTAGILTVTDGTHTAHVHLTGNYLSSTWTLSNDGLGGTVVVDPTAPAAPSPAVQAITLAHATASFAIAAPGAVSTAAVGAHVNLPMLGVPRPAWGS
ncbi:MAG TPA: hypothetical protein VG166_00540 [Caulobacteraceae bacterium]|jgi:hypothetical protein|nr:hypothetical protein [Caulobacteraceae bacterium]